MPPSFTVDTCYSTANTSSSSTAELVAVNITVSFKVSHETQELDGGNSQENSIQLGQIVKKPGPPVSAPSAPSERQQSLFMISITHTQLVQSIPLRAGINSGQAIGKALGASPLASSWVCASYPLTQGSFVVVGGRLGGIYGHRTILSAGCIWWIV